MSLEKVRPAGFEQMLLRDTAADREFLWSAPVIRRCLDGDIDRALYIRFLTQAYHHVRHTVPLLDAVAARLPQRHAWLREPIAHYLHEEQGHDEWILDDIAESGGDPVLAAASPPAIPTEAMVAYAYDTVLRGNPVGFFGMVHVLEGTSASLATRAADAIQSALGLPSRAVTYLRSHGALDQEHVQHLGSILERLADVDREAVTRCAKAIYWLYGHMFRALEDRSTPVVSTQAERRSA